MPKPKLDEIIHSLKTYMENLRCKQILPPVDEDCTPDYRAGYQKAAFQAESMLGVLMWELGIDLRPSINYLSVKCPKCETEVRTYLSELSTLHKDNAKMREALNHIAGHRVSSRADPDAWPGFVAQRALLGLEHKEWMETSEREEIKYSKPTDIG